MLKQQEIFGFSLYNLMNLIGKLCIYVVICEHEGRPMHACMHACVHAKAIRKTQMFSDEDPDVCLVM